MEVWPDKACRCIGICGDGIYRRALTRKNINAIFFICFVIGIMSLITVFRMPTVKRTSIGRKQAFHFRSFQKQRTCAAYGFTLVIHTTMGFYNTFFPIYYKNMGADNTILGLAVFIGSASEIIFLVFGDRIIKRWESSLRCSVQRLLQLYGGQVWDWLTIFLQCLHSKFSMVLYSLFWPTPWQHISIMRCHLNWRPQDRR